MHTDQQFDTYPVVQPGFGSEQMSAEMVRRSQEQIAASIALLQSRAKTRHVEQLEGIETPPPVPAFGCDDGASDSDVPSQALNARLIALLLPCWLEGLGDGSCRGEGGT
jgi:hypothetical protein